MTEANQKLSKSTSLVAKSKTIVARYKMQQKKKDVAKKKTTTARSKISISKTKQNSQQRFVNNRQEVDKEQNQQYSFSVRGYRRNFIKIISHLSPVMTNNLVCQLIIHKNFCVSVFLFFILDMEFTILDFWYSNYHFVVG